MVGKASTSLSFYFVLRKTMLPSPFFFTLRQRSSNMFLLSTLISLLCKGKGEGKDKDKDKSKGNRNSFFGAVKEGRALKKLSLNFSEAAPILFLLASSGKASEACFAFTGSRS
jgi:hypothetical protein